MFFFSHCISFSWKTVQKKLIEASKHYQYFWQKIIAFSNWLIQLMIDLQTNSFFVHRFCIGLIFFRSQFLLLIFILSIYFFFWITAPKTKLTKWVNQYCQIAVQQFLAYQTTKSCTNYNTTSKKNKQIYIWRIVKRHLNIETWPCLINN